MERLWSLAVATGGNRWQRTTSANTERPAPLHGAFIAAAQEVGFPLLDDPDDRALPIGIAAAPANVVAGVRCRRSPAPTRT